MWCKRRSGGSRFFSILGWGCLLIQLLWRHLLVGRYVVLVLLRSLLRRPPLCPLCSVSSASLAGTDPSQEDMDEVSEKLHAAIAKTNDDMRTIIDGIKTVCVGRRHGWMLGPGLIEGHI